MRRVILLSMLAAIANASPALAEKVRQILEPVSVDEIDSLPEDIRRMVAAALPEFYRRDWDHDSYEVGIMEYSDVYHVYFMIPQPRTMRGCLHPCIDVHISPETGKMIDWSYMR